MAIVVCPNGHKTWMPDEVARTATLCPACRAPLPVPEGLPPTPPPAKPPVGLAPPKPPLAKRRQPVGLLVRLGLGWRYVQVLLIVLALVLVILTAVLTTARVPWPDEVFQGLHLTIEVVAILSFLLGIAGCVACLWVPAETRGRLMLVVSLLLSLVLIPRPLLVLAPAVFGLPPLTVHVDFGYWGGWPVDLMPSLIWLAGIILEMASWAFFLVFLH